MKSHALGLLVALALLCCVAINAQSVPGYKTFWFDQTLDHFNPETQPQTFQQRYLVNDTWFDPLEGVIFFYTGNEGDIEEFWNNTGLPFDLAPEFKALVVFAEHRYYGQSLPFGQDSFNTENIGYLSIEQALADYATLIPAIKSSINAPEDAIVISFGGSYGGMLTAYFRTLYPNVVDMGLAASAPFMLLNPSFVQTPGFYEAVTNDFAAADARCPDYYRDAFSQVLKIKEAGGYDLLTKYFNLCSPLTEELWDWFFMWMVTSFGEMAMCDYPYPSNFLAPLPAWPIAYSCELMINATIYGEGTLQGLIETVSLFYNGTDGTLPCFNITSEYLPCSDQSGCGTGNDGLSWDYQACAEIIYFPNTNNVTDMFPARDWTLSNLTQHCQERWSITPRPGWVNTFAGLAQISQASRIIFSNGLLDPWHGGGLLLNLTDSLVSVIIAEGAHHLDLRASNPEDPVSVIAARETEANYFTQWINEINAQRAAKKAAAAARK